MANKKIKSRWIPFSTLMPQNGMLVCLLSSSGNRYYGIYPESFKPFLIKTCSVWMPVTKIGKLNIDGVDLTN